MWPWIDLESCNLEDEILSTFICPLSLIEQPLIVRIDFQSWNMEAKLKGHQDGKFGGQEVATIQSEDCLSFLVKKVH